jgi:hypothetical protein
MSGRFEVPSRGSELENNSGKRVLDTLRCTEKNRVGVVKARTDEGESDKRRCVVVKAGSNVSKSVQMVGARLRDVVRMFVKGERLVKCDTEEFDGIR